MSQNIDVVEDFIFSFLDEKLSLQGLDRGAFNDLGQTNLIAAGILDSVQFLDLMAAVEERFHVELDLEQHDPAFFTTPNGFVACVCNSGPV